MVGVYEGVYEVAGGVLEGKRLKLSYRKHGSSLSGILSGLSLGYYSLKMFFFRK